MDVGSLIRNDTIIRDSHDYYCLHKHGWGVISSKKLANIKDEPIMSLRLSTGIIGHIDCPSGKQGPRGSSEVILAVGISGIESLVKLGALPCFVCNSGNDLLLMGTQIKNAVLDNTESVENIDDVEWLTSHYDARRLDWSQLTKLGLSPSRFYTQPHLSHKEISKIANIFKASSLKVPTIGYYDKQVAGHFQQY